jgi:DNA-binding transcriptional ArsR family regulator
MTDRRRRFTDEEVEHILKLQSDGLKPAVIAERTGRTRGSIYVLLHKHRKASKEGTVLRFTLDDALAHAARVEFLFTHGVTITELARIYEVSQAAISQTLARLGLMEELRDEARLELPPVAKTNTSYATRYSS